MPILQDPPIRRWGRKRAIDTVYAILDQESGYDQLMVAPISSMLTAGFLAMLTNMYLHGGSNSGMRGDDLLLQGPRHFSQGHGQAVPTNPVVIFPRLWNWRSHRSVGLRNVAQAAVPKNVARPKVAAIQMAVKDRLRSGPHVKKLTIEEWRQHIRQNHIPYRRDCRVCVQEMGPGRTTRSHGRHRGMM